MRLTALELTRALSALRPDCVIYVPCEDLADTFNTTDEVRLQILESSKEHQSAILVPTEGKWAGKTYKIPEKKP